MIKFAKYVGVNTDYLTAQAYIFPKNIPVEEALDKPFSTLLISASGEDVFTKIRQASSMVEELIYSSQEPVSLKIDKVFNFLTEQLRPADDLQVLIVCASKDIVYLKSQGAHKAFLLRGQKLTELTSSIPQGYLISGYIQAGDRLLLINSRLESQIKPEEKREDLYSSRQIEALISSPLDNFEETAEDLLKDIKHLEPIATVLIVNQPLVEQAGVTDELQSPGRFKIPNFFQKPAFLKLIGKRNIWLGLSLLGLTILLGGGVYFGTKFWPSQENKADNPQSLPTQSGNQTEVTNIHQVSDWPVFLSLDLIKGGFSLSKIAYSLGKILLLDEASKTLVTVDLTNKNPQILAGSVQLGQAKFASLNGDQALVFSADKGVLKIDLSSKKVSTVAKLDEEWGQVVDIIGFGSNVYLLSQDKNQIFKYTPIESGYSNKINYIKEGQKIDFGGAKKLQIDYSVWVLKNGANIDKFTAGNLDYFAFGGLEKPFKEIKSFFPTEEADTIYFLDPENQRLVVTKKNGAYLSQYTGEKFSTASDFIIDEEGKKIYLLEGGKIYQIELK